MGRKKIIWPEEKYRQFEKLCSLQCTEEEICCAMDVTDKTLNRLLKAHYGMSFSEAFQKYSAVGKISLRRTQFRLAERSDRMAIWLGKQYLGQKEPEQELRQTLQAEDKEGKSNVPEEWVAAVLAAGDISVPDKPPVPEGMQGEEPSHE